MITTSSFPNTITACPDDDKLVRNTLTKEDLEGKVKNNIYNTSHKNGGSCRLINI